MPLNNVFSDGYNELLNISSEYDDIIPMIPEETDSTYVTDDHSNQENSLRPDFDPSSFIGIIKGLPTWIWLILIGVVLYYYRGKL